MAAVKRALLSCYDKTRLDEFARGLAALGIELVASSGTAKFLQQHGLTAATVEQFAGVTEQLEGRVKTLHPKIHAGILARRDDPAHVETVGTAGLIDLVAVNLYPFEETIRRGGVSLEAALEQVDIGGVALLRAAAKNFPHVVVVSEPGQYHEVLSALREGGGTLPEPACRRLGAAAFQLTSRYDHAIAAFLAGGEGSPLPEQVTMRLRRYLTMRYGENPHQAAAWYVASTQPLHGLATSVARQGKPLSYNNLLDVDAAVRCVAEFSEPACVIVKHASPCGAATAPALAEAYRRAYAGDAESAFGGIVAVNRPLDAATASQMTATFLEVIAAPSLEPAALAAFAKKPNLRLIELGPAAAAPEPEWRSVAGGWLMQCDGQAPPDPSAWKVVTSRRPTEAQQRDLAFAWRVAKHVRSNAIVIANDQATVGIGQGQPSRVRAVQLAIRNAGERCRGAALASDGFFPFPDNVEQAAAGGLAAIIQPGGSVKDADVIAAADRAGLTMVFTGARQFRH